jgi:sugar/nucleoside kinase (ribokinase family)
MTHQIDAIVAGHICLDIYPDLSGSEREPFEKAFLPGRLISTGPVTFCTGGPVSNTGLALHRLGISTRLAGKVGDDLFGQAILQIINTHGAHLANGMKIDSSASTSYTVLINYPGIDRIFLHCPGANDTFSADDVPYESIWEARLFHFGYPPLMRTIFQNDGAQLVELFQRAKATGVTTSLDMALPDPSSASGQADWRHILERTLPHVDIFLPSVEEILFMLRRELYFRLSETAGFAGIVSLLTTDLLSSLGDELLGMGAKIVVLKLGDRGLYLRTANTSTLIDLGRAASADLSAWGGREFWAPCFEVQVAGTTGSGDATIAGFLAAFLRGYSPESTLTIAVAVGACNVEAADALTGIRSWDATRERIDQGWARRTLNLNAPGWNFDPACGHWRGPGA